MDNYNETLVGVSIRLITEPNKENITEPNFFAVLKIVPNRIKIFNNRKKPKSIFNLVYSVRFGDNRNL